MKKISWFARFGIVLSMFVWIGPAGAEFECKVLKKVSLPTAPRDVAVSPDEKWYYILTEGNVLIFSAVENRIVENIPVGKGADRIVHAPENNLLIVSDGKEKNFQVIQIDAIHDFDLKGSPYVGAADAPATVVIFNHYHCLYCARLDPKIKELIDLFGANVKVVYKNFPPYSDIARKASAAAVAAHRQGKFWQFHRAVHEMERPVEVEKIIGVAESIGLDVEKFKTDLEDPKTMALVDRDVKEGLAADVDAVPFFFINGKHLKNEDLDLIYRRIEEEIAKSVFQKSSDENKRK